MCAAHVSCPLRADLAREPGDPALLNLATCAFDPEKPCVDRAHAHHAVLRCQDDAPLLNATRRDDFTACLADTLGRHRFGLLAYAIVPARVELIIVPRRTPTTVARFLFMLKRPFATRFQSEVRAGEPDLLAKLNVRTGVGQFVFRFWEAGPGPIERLDSPERLLARIADVHALPIERGLAAHPHEWPWSTAATYHDPARVDDLSAALVPIPPALRLTSDALHT